LTWPDETLVYPGHDYKGETVSTIGEERAHNPRLQIDSPEAYVAQMAALNLPNPKMMDIAVPANLAIGAAQSAAGQAWYLECTDAAAEMGNADVIVVDLREDSERRRNGVIPGSLHAPYGYLERFLSPGRILHYESTTARKRLVYYCAFGERSALAVETSHEMGVGNVCHIVGGMDAWSRFGGPVEDIASRPKGQVE
jgi:sulfur dioxygenase